MISSEQKLVRAIGLPGIVALTINGIIGAGIFALPANAAKVLGAGSPIAFAIAGLVTGIIVLCFAELGSKFDRTGGAYLYASKAFGEGIIAFLIGWLYLLSRITSIAALSNAMVSFVGFFLPINPTSRFIFLFVLFLLLGIVNYIGVRFSSRLINFLTVAKLLPLTLFIIAGLFFVRWGIYSKIAIPAMHDMTSTVLIVMFAFTGFEVIAVPGAEIIEPRRTLPLGLLLGTGLTIVVYLLIQTVAVGVLPGIANSQSPLAEAAQTFLGREGAVLLTAGAVCSTMGTLTALLLVAPRILYAMAVHGQMPQILNAVHPRFRTPHVAIIFCTAFAGSISLAGSFTVLATLSAIARMLVFIGSAIALIVLRRKMPSADTFQVPGGITAPLLTVLLSLLLLTATNRTHWLTGSAALALGLLLYFLAPGKLGHKWTRRSKRI
jgi:amino acid transporter